MANEPNWTGVVLEGKSVRKLEELFKNYMQPYMNKWFIAADHATIAAYNPPEWIQAHKYVGTKYKVWAYEIGWNETTIAVKVKFDKMFKTTAAFPHITLAYSKDGRGGYNSNFITLWERLPESIELKGIVKEGTRNFVNHRPKR